MANLIGKVISIMSVFLLALGSSLGISNAATPSSVCTGVYNVVIGGLAVSIQGGWQSSAYLSNGQRVEYDSWRPLQGLENLNSAIQDHRNQCPGDHIKIVGHSEGAAIAHQWIAEHHGFGRINGILLADPKRVAGPGWAGLADIPGSFLIGYPLSGVDANFGDTPVLTICQHDDMVCNTEAGWFGYLFTGAHVRYNFDANYYGTDWRGVAFL